MSDYAPNDGKPMHEKYKGWVKREPSDKPNMGFCLSCDKNIYRQEGYMFTSRPRV